VAQKWKILVPTLLVVLAAALIYFKVTNASGAADGRRGGTPVVHVEFPRLETVVTRLRLNGDVLPIRQAGIFSKVGGNLERIYTDMGVRVRANELLASIDSTELHQQVQQTAATYQNALNGYERTKQLFEKNLASKQDIDNADATMKVARANYDAALTRISYSQITAPFHGFITRRYLDPGALVTANSATLFTLMALDTVRIIVNVPEKDVASVYGVHRADVELDALPNRTYQGRVARFSQAIDLSTRTMPIEVVVPNPRNEIKPGMFATVSLTVAQRPNALTLASNVILRDENGMYAFVIKDQRARRVRVTTGPEQDSRVEILSGLTGTDSVVVAGQQFAKDGGPVIVK
jgi:RND family efflux transporter MFP subunit